LVATQVMNGLFVPWLGQAGLALSIGLGALLNAGLLLRGLKQGGAYQAQPGWLAFAVRVALACCVLALVLLWAARSVDWIGLQQQLFLRAACMAAVLVVATLAYFLTLRVTGLDLRQFRRRA
jgi:putative peptidoglycan lipid II flippase